jgi:hypothetical protein
LRAPPQGATMQTRVAAVLVMLLASQLSHVHADAAPEAAAAAALAWSAARMQSDAVLASEHLQEQLGSSEEAPPLDIDALLASELDDDASATTPPRAPQAKLASLSGLLRAGGARLRPRLKAGGAKLQRLQHSLGGEMRRRAQPFLESMARGERAAHWRAGAHEGEEEMRPDETAEAWRGRGNQQAAPPPLAGEFVQR